MEPCRKHPLKIHSAHTRNSGCEQAHYTQYSRDRNQLLCRQRHTNLLSKQFTEHNFETQRFQIFSFDVVLACDDSIAARAAHHIHVPERRIRQRAAFCFVRVGNALWLWLRTLANTARETNRWRCYRIIIMRSVGTNATVAKIALKSRITLRVLKYREHSHNFCCYSVGSGGECCASKVYWTQSYCAWRTISKVFLSFIGIKIAKNKNILIYVQTESCSECGHRTSFVSWRRTSVIACDMRIEEDAKSVHLGSIAWLQADPKYFLTIGTYLYVFWSRFWFVFIGNIWIISASFSFISTEWWIVKTVELSTSSYLQFGERIRKHCCPHIVSHIFNGENYTLKTTFN